MTASCLLPLLCLYVLVATYEYVALPVVVLPSSVIAARAGANRHNLRHQNATVQQPSHHSSKTSQAPVPDGNHGERAVAYILPSGIIDRSHRRGHSHPRRSYHLDCTRAVSRS